MSKATYLTNATRKLISERTAGRVKTFRTNAGAFWQGEIISMDGQILILKNPRQIEGLPEGFPDLLAIIPTEVTPQMLGQTVGIVGFIEIKTENDRMSRKQEQFLALARAAGCRAGVARSADDGLKIIAGIPL